MTSAFIVLTTVLSYAIAWAVGIPVLVPVFNTLAAFPFMVVTLARSGVRPAVARMLVWALALGACATLLSYARPARTETLFLRAEAYRTEMLAWVMTGRGAESEPARFIPEQAAHAAIFSVLALVSGGALALMAGAVLMNDMGHYVGALAAASAHPVLTIVLAWHPWAVIRIVSFVTIGVILAAPLLSWAGGFRVDTRSARRLLVWAVAGLVADVVLKSLLAPAWQRLLLRVVTGR